MASSTEASLDTRLATTLAHLLRPPLPGCIFIQATSPSDQLTALDQIRHLTASPSDLYITAETHPHLLGSRLTELRRDLQTAFAPIEEHRGQEEDQLNTSGPATDEAAAAAPTFNSSISIFPHRLTAHGTTKPRLLIIPSAHLLRATHPPLLWSQFLHPSPDYTVLAISSIPLDRWRTADAVEEDSGTRPIVRLTFKGLDLSDLDTGECSSSSSNDKAVVRDVLLKALPSSQDQSSTSQRERFKPLFVEYVHSSLSSEVAPQDIEELCFLTRAIWIALEKIVVYETDTGVKEGDVEARYKDRPSLLRLVAPLVRGALRDLLPRKLGLSQWIESVVNRGTGRDESLCRKGTSVAAPLPPLASLLVIAAFLASHLPPRTDTRFFLRDSSLLSTLAKSSKKVRRSKRRSGPRLDDDLDWDVAFGGGGGGGTTSNSNPLLLGPKPFGLQRMLYIFENLCTELNVTLPSFQREMLHRRKRRRKEEEYVLSDAEDGDDQDHEDGQVRGRRLFSGSGKGDTMIDGPSKVDITSLGIQHTLLSLVQAGYLVFVGPPVTGSIATSIGSTSVGDRLPVGGEGEGAAQGEEVIVATTATGLCLPPIPSKLEAVTQVTMRCNVLKEELRLLILGEEEIERPDAFEAKKKKKTTTATATAMGVAKEEDVRRRKEWWTRLEECGL